MSSPGFAVDVGALERHAQTVDRIAATAAVAKDAAELLDKVNQIGPHDYAYGQLCSVFDSAISRTQGPTVDCVTGLHRLLVDLAEAARSSARAYREAELDNTALLVARLRELDASDARVGRN